MKRIKIGFWALALSGLLLQSCGNEESSETTNVDSTTMTTPSADNTADGISDAQMESTGTDMNNNATGTSTSDAATSNSNANTSSGANSSHPGTSGSGNSNTGTMSTTSRETDDAPVSVQNRGGDQRKPNKAGVKNPPEIDRHLNKDSVNNSTGLGTSR